MFRLHSVWIWFCYLAGCTPAANGHHNLLQQPTDLWSNLSLCGGQSWFPNIFTCLGSWMLGWQCLPVRLNGSRTGSTGHPHVFYWRNASSWDALQNSWTNRFIVSVNRFSVFCSDQPGRVQRDITPYRGHAHKRYSSLNRVPEHDLTTFFVLLPLHDQSAESK